VLQTACFSSNSPLTSPSLIELHLLTVASSRGKCWRHLGYDQRAAAKFNRLSRSTEALLHIALLRNSRRMYRISCARLTICADARKNHDAMNPP
jgi:hypothetical protein